MRAKNPTIFHSTIVLINKTSAEKNQDKVKLYNEL